MSKELITEDQEKAGHFAAEMLRSILPFVHDANLPMLEYLVGNALLEAERIEGAGASINAVQ
jgi:hypothetical protein